MKGRRVLSSAPAKLIITGEHAVVYNEPAIVCAIDKRVKVSVSPRESDEIYVFSDAFGFPLAIGLDRVSEGLSHPQYGYVFYVIGLVFESVGERPKPLNIEITSEAPVGVGLGSSASLAVSLSAGLLRFLGYELEERQLFKISMEAERFAHKNPSGVDVTIAMHGGVIAYRKNEPYVELKAPKPLKFIVTDSGKKRATREMVEKVAALLDKHHDPVRLVMHAIGHLSIQAGILIRKGDYQGLGRLLTMNHWLLASLGVSTPELDRIVYTSLENGALGSKLTGAGGGGCAISLPDEGAESYLLNALSKLGPSFVAEVETEGVRVEEL